MEFTPDQFMPLPARRVLYLVGLVCAAVAPVLAITHPDYAAAIISGAGVLNAAAIGTAIANAGR